MGMDDPLYSIKNYPNFIDEVNKFLAKDISPRFELVYPQLVITVKWKLITLFAEKLMRKKNLMNAYIPKFIPKDFPLYERTGLMIWYDQEQSEGFFYFLILTSISGKLRSLIFILFGENVEEKKCQKIPCNINKLLRIKAFLSIQHLIRRKFY